MWLCYDMDKFWIDVFSSLIPTNPMDRNIDPIVPYPAVLNYPYVGKQYDVMPSIPSLGQYVGFRKQFTCDRYFFKFYSSFCSDFSQVFSSRSLY